MGRLDQALYVLLFWGMPLLALVLLADAGRAIQRKEAPLIFIDILGGLAALAGWWCFRQFRRTLEKQQQLRAEAEQLRVKQEQLRAEAELPPLPPCGHVLLTWACPQCVAWQTAKVEEQRKEWAKAKEGTADV